MRKLEQAFPEGVVIVGVHAGKFIAERVTANIQRAVERLGVHHPVVNDRQFRVWREYAVSAWPTVTLIDAAGYVVAQQAGEIPAQALIPVVERLLNDARRDGTLDLSSLPFTTDPEPVPPPGLRFPAKLTIDETGNVLFIADTGNSRIVAVRLDTREPTGHVEWVAGGAESGFRDGPLEDARFDHPHGLAVVGDALFVADTGNHAIRRIGLTSGQVATLAGTGEQAKRWVAAPEPAASAITFPGRSTALNSPWDVHVHRRALFIAMAGSHQIWRMDLTNAEVSPWCGSGAEAIEDGAPNVAALAQPSGLTSGGGRLYFADSESSAIRWAHLVDRTVHTIVGAGLFDFGDRDGVGERVRLQHPLAVALEDGRLYVADSYNNKIKRVDPETREVVTWLGEDMGLSEPSGLALLGNKLYIADTNNHRIVVANMGTGETAVLTIAGL